MIQTARRAPRALHRAPIASASVLALLLLGACNRQAGAGQGGGAGPAPVKDEPYIVDTSGPADPVASPQAVKGGTFTTWGGGFPKSLNVWLDPNSFSGQIMGLLFENLVQLHPTRNDPVPYLANRWEVAADNGSFTFHLDPAARWSDGQPVTAADVQFYYDVLMDPKNLTPVWRVPLRRFERPQVIDSLTVKVVVKEKHWRNFWDAGSLGAFPKHAWGGKDFNQINFDFPVVSGPYSVQDLKKDGSLTLRRRGDWWGRAKRFNQHKYNFDYLKYIFMEDRVKALEAFKRGDFDAYPIYTASIWATQTDFEAVRKGWVAKQRVFNQAPIGFQGFAVNLRRPLLQDKRVREALCLLLNRPLMNDKLMFNQYFLLNSYYPDLYPNNTNPSAPVLGYDPERARALLDQAGWKAGSDGVLAKGGQRFVITLPLATSDLRHYNIYLEDLKKVGIEAHLDQLSQSSLTKKIDQHDYDLYWSAWGADRLRDPEPQWSSATADENGSNNYPGLKDGEVDRYITQLKTETDLDKRNALLRQLDARLVDLIPYVLLWEADNHRLLYWKKFGTPPYVLDKYDDEAAMIPYWWVDPAKDKELAAARGDGRALEQTVGDVHYRE